MNGEEKELAKAAKDVLAELLKFHFESEKWLKISPVVHKLTKAIFEFEIALEEDEKCKK